MFIERHLSRFMRGKAASGDTVTVTPLEAEIEQCLLYFEGIQEVARVSRINTLNEEAAKNGLPPPIIPEIFKQPTRFKSIHIMKYTVGRLEEGKGYFWETGDNVRHAIGKETVPNDIVPEIQSMTRNRKRS